MYAIHVSIARSGVTHPETMLRIGRRSVSIITSVPIRFDLVHSNVCGLMPHQSLGGASYFVSFIDDSIRTKDQVWAYPIRTKDQVFSIFTDWLAMVENQTGRKLKCLRSDNGGEFKSEEFVKFCRERGIRREYTTPYSPEQNGIA